MLRARRRKSRSTVSTAFASAWLTSSGSVASVSRGAVSESALGGGKGADDVEELLFRDPDERPPQQCTKGERIAPVGKRADEGNQVLRLLPPEQALAGLRDQRQSVVLERALISPEVCAGGGEQGYIAGDKRAGPSV